MRRKFNGERASMTTTALDLYSDAYTKQYKEKDLEKACVIYKEIIQRFPESQECAYAGMQLEKIGATIAVSEPKSRVKGWIVALFIVNFLLLAGLAGAAAVMYTRVQNRMQAIHLQIRALRSTEAHNGLAPSADIPQ